MYAKTLMEPITYCFETFQVEAQTGVLTRDGVRIPIQELPFQLLVVLLERPGELVSREELRERLWPSDVHLEFEGALSTAVKKLRQALGDTAKPARIIETLPGRGYRFLLQVDRETPVAEAWDRVIPFQPVVPSRRRLARRIVYPALAVLALVLLALWRPWSPAPKPPGYAPALLVLPAKVVGPEGVSYLADAIPEGLSTLLAGVEGLEIKSPPTSVQVEKLAGDLARIAEAFGVGFLVRSTVVVEGGQLRLTVMLTEVGTQKLRWAKRYEGTQAAYGALLEEAAQGILQALRLTGRGLLGKPAFRSEVELALREGHYFQRRYVESRDARDFDQALAAFHRALALEPSSALLAAEIAALFDQQHFQHRDPRALAEAERWVALALERDPRCGRAWGVLSWLASSRPRADPAKVVDAALKAVRYAPSDAKTFTVLACVSPTVGYQFAAGQRAIALDPLDHGGYCAATFALPAIGRAEEALPIIERAFRIHDTPGFHTWIKYLCLFQAGRFEEAGQAYTEVQWAGVSRMMRCLMAGDNAGAERLGKEAVLKWKRGGANATSEDWVNRTLFYGPLLARVGMTEEALWLLDQCTLAKAPPPFDMLLLNPDFRQLRSDPRYARALAASRDYALRFLKQADTLQARGEYPAALEPALSELRALVEAHAVAAVRK